MSIGRCVEAGSETARPADANVSFQAEDVFRWFGNHSFADPRVTS